MFTTMQTSIITQLLRMAGAAFKLDVEKAQEVIDYLPHAAEEVMATKDLLERRIAQYDAAFLKLHAQMEEIRNHLGISENVRNQQYGSDRPDRERINPAAVPTRSGRVLADPGRG